jgi:hypothetical protein
MGHFGIRPLFALLITITIAVAGCSTKSTAGPAGGPPGSFTVTFGPITVQPGVENTQCIVVPLGNPTPIHVGQIHNILGNASHHMIVYKVSDTTAKLTPFKCQPFTDTLDPTKGSVLMVTQKKDDLLSLPSGVGYTLDANQMLRLEMHYINPDSTAQTLQSTSTMIPIPDAQYQNEAGFLFIGDPDITLPPNATTTLGPIFFPVPSQFANAQFFAITGHEHKLGTNVVISTASSKTDPGTQVYNVPNWLWSEPATVTSSPPFSIPAGGGFKFSCTWNNTSQSTVAFGESATNEMCFFWAYYYPSIGSHVCIHTDIASGGLDFCCPGSQYCSFFGGGNGTPDAGSSVCNGVTNAAAAVPMTNVASAAPQPTGGTIPDGTYFVTAYQQYTGTAGASGPTGVTYQGTNVVAGGTYNSVTHTSSNPVDASFSGTFKTSGTGITIQQTCPSPQTAPFTSYDSDGVKVVTVFGSTGTSVTAITYTKQ